MTIIKIPDELAQEIDRIAGLKKRSSYAADLLWKEVQRTRQREALKATRGAWSQEAHPELAAGAAAYVEQLRSEQEERFEAALEGRGQ